MVQQYLLASDFDQTLSFNDSGVVLAELVGVQGFHDKVRGLAQINLVQQGAELSYLILHDPEFRRIRREHLIEAGKLIRLKHDVKLFTKTLDTLADGYKFNFHVISAAPQEIIQSALEGIVAPENIHGTKFYYEPGNGEVKAIVRASAGWGKVTVLEIASAVDCGTVIHPAAAAGQVTGAATQGLGLALTEYFDWHNGAPTDPQFKDYPIPSAAMMPRIGVKARSSRAKTPKRSNAVTPTACAHRESAIVVSPNPTMSRR